jgi:hypothetical protein
VPASSLDYILFEKSTSEDTKTNKTNILESTINNLMSASSQAKLFYTPKTPTATGQLSFSQKGPEFERLRGLMEAHGASLQYLTLTGIVDKDPFLPSSNQAWCTKNLFHQEGACVA